MSKKDEEDHNCICFCDTCQTSRLLIASINSSLMNVASCLFWIIVLFMFSRLNQEKSKSLFRQNFCFSINYFTVKIITEEAMADRHYRSPNHIDLLTWKIPLITEVKSHLYGFASVKCNELALFSLLCFVDMQYLSLGGEIGARWDTQIRSHRNNPHNMA